MEAVHLILLHPAKNVCVTIPMLQRKLLSLTSTRRMRRTSEVVIDYDLSIANHTIMISKSNKRKLASVLATFDLGENTTMDTRDDGAFRHDEADVTMISFV